MKITLTLVRQVLKDTLGFDSFIAGFVQRIEEDEQCPSAAISANGTMRYNPGFCDEYIACQQDLFSLVFHEILHPAFCHFIYRGGQVENIAADAIINATISQAYSHHSRRGQLFRKLYKPEGLEGLLRPGSRMSDSNVPSTVSVLNIIKKLPARYMSWLNSALSSSGPVVGRLRTTEMMVEPEISPGRT